MNTPANQRDLQWDATCRTCGYALRGLEFNRCPECGRDFDPQNPATMYRARPWSDVAPPPSREWLEPTSPKTRLYKSAAFICLAIGMVPAPDVLLLLGTLIVWLPVGVVYQRRAELRAVAVRYYNEPRSILKVDARLRRRVRLTFVATIVAAFLHLPFYVAFFASLPFLNHIAEAIMNAPANLPAKKHMAGLYWVFPSQPTPFGFDAYLGPTGGFAPITYDLSPERSWSSHGRKIHGNWYFAFHDRTDTIIGNN